MRRPTEKTLQRAVAIALHHRTAVRQPTTAALFDAQPVSQDDIATWLRAVPGIEPGSARAVRYAATYDVAGKIARAKATGEWPPSA